MLPLMDAQALGRYLRQTRETQELSLEDAEHTLKIRRAVLEAFELGEFSIPNLSPVQLRGFVRNYGRYLGLDEDRIMAQFDEALSGGGRSSSGSTAFGAMRKKNKRDTASSPPAASLTDTHPKLQPVQAQPVMPTSLPPSPRGASTAVVLVRGLVALAALAIIAFVVVQLLPIGQAADPSQEIPGDDILAQLPPTSTQPLAPTPTLLVVVAASAGPQSAYTGQGLLLELTMAQRGWLRIAADNIEQFVGLARPGQQFQIRAIDNITLTSSNAEALDAIYNGQRQASYGGRGVQVDITYSTDGIAISTGADFAPTPITSDTPAPTPTDPAGALIAQLSPSPSPGPSPTASNTPTETLTPSVTFTPSETYTPSNTPTQTLTPSTTFTPSNTPTQTPLPSDTLTPTRTLTPSTTPTPTNTVSPTPSAVLPLRQTPAGATPTKPGG